MLLKHFRNILLTLTAFVAVVVCVPIAMSQTAPVTDTQFWPDVQISKDLDKEKNWNATLLLQSRFGNGLSTTTDARVGLIINRKLNKNFSVGGTYMYRYTNATFNSKGYAHRFMGHVQAARSLGNGFEVVARTMVGRDLRMSRPDETVWRNQVRLKKKITTGNGFVEPYISYEHFYSLTNTRHLRHREMIGIVRPLSKRLSLDVYYLRQDDASTSRPRNLNTIGTSFRIKL